MLSRFKAANEYVMLADDTSTSFHLFYLFFIFILKENEKHP